MLAEQKKPLIAIEIAPGDVGEKVVAEIGLGLRGEDECALAGKAELVEKNGGIGPAAGGTGEFPGVELDVTGVGKTEHQRLFGGNDLSLFGLCGAFQMVVDGAKDETLEENEVLQVFCDGPTVGRLAKVPLIRGEAGCKRNKAGVAGDKFFEEKSAFLWGHGLASI